ncbi:agamous-like MADS-box protein AGL70 isoform X2 [Raphanus sativus]|uniref:Agamous-like MADS-box protein AGL70 isoform X2 n=1 Tax=Raphanus sativus TaxID=3726 RepID=A0A9W3CT19_RAPSA|nr:agamous-like MADS-box protein AGL70 isoform X2 [Raphanus sativus]
MLFSSIGSDTYFCFVLDISSMTNIIDRYEIQHAGELRSLDLAEKTRIYLPHNELLESVKSNLEESNVDNVSVDSLISLEDQLETALSATRARKTELKMEFVKMLQEKEELLRQENLVLASQIGKTNGGRENNSPENSSGINPPETLPLLK